MTITPVTDNDNDLWFGFGERKGSCNENYDFYDGTIEATRLFIGPWENRIDFIKSKVMAEITPGENNNQSIIPPNSYPDNPAATAYKADVKGIFVDGQNEEDQFQITYKYAAITVHYKIFPFGLPGGGTVDVEFIQETVEATSELIPIPYNFDVFDDSPGYKLAGVTKLKGHRDGKLNKVITILHYKLTIPIVVEPDFEILGAYSGRVNGDYRFLLPSGYIADTDTMRYDGFSSVSRREISHNRLAWSITLNFAFYVGGWNTLPTPVLTDPDDPDSDVIMINAPIDPPLYESADLNKLLYGLDFDPTSNPSLDPSQDGEIIL